MMPIPLHVKSYDSVGLGIASPVSRVTRSVSVWPTCAASPSAAGPAGVGAAADLKAALARVAALPQTGPGAIASPGGRRPSAPARPGTDAERRLASDLTSPGPFLLTAQVGRTHGEVRLEVRDLMPFNVRDGRAGEG